MATTATVAVAAVGPPSTAPAHPEEDAAKKKNTDCVYFLASPLTCKKGDECEFRHSESARLNPRDCWYWLGGNCRNRDCPFRHPPLDQSRAAAAAAPPPTPVHQKKPVPCYFFSQGICAKGTKCQFLHENAASSNVYRLSDTTSKAPSSDTPKSDSVQQTPEKRKDMVFRLQKPGPSREGSEEVTEQHKQRKSHKESYTWKLSDSTPQKQGSDATTPVSDSKRKRSSDGTVSDSKRRMSDSTVSDSVEASEEFAAPKSLHQIKEEREKERESHTWKLSDSAAPESKRKRRSDGTEPTAMYNGAEGTELDEEDEDEYAQRLQSFWS